MNKKEMIKMMVVKTAKNLVENKELTYEGTYLIEEVSYTYELNTIKELYSQLVTVLNARIGLGQEVSEIDMKKVEVMKKRAAVLKENIKNSKF